MTFTLDSLKDSLLKMDILIEKENRIWIEELNIPEYFDIRTHYIYLPIVMKENFQGQILPEFLRFSEFVTFNHMYIVEKYMVPNENKWGVF